MKNESVPTSTAATRRTEPAVVAGIASGEGQPPVADQVAQRTFSRQSRVALAALALGAVAGSWLRRVSVRG